MTSAASPMETTAVESERPASQGGRLLPTGKGAARPKLVVGAAHDTLEQEADSVAEGNAGRPISGLAAGGSLATTERSGTGPASPSVEDALAAPGGLLEPGVRREMEGRLGHDFGQVRVHHDVAADRSARELGAAAYTVGAHLVFRAGQYAPGTRAGRALLAHELAHVVQQSRSPGRMVQRALMRLGELTISIDYDAFALLSADEQIAQIDSLLAAFTNVPTSAGRKATIRGLAGRARTWLLYGLKLLVDNAAAAPTLDPTSAIQRLLQRARRARHEPLPDPENLFVREVLDESGWSEAALTGRLSAPGPTETAAIRTIVNPPPTTGAVTDPLDVPTFRARLEPALKNLLEARDPGKWTSVGTQSMSALRTLGDTVQEEARRFFSPYADTARGNIFSVQPPWKASAHIFDVGAMTPDRDTRLSFLLNRAEIVGRNTELGKGYTDTNIFPDVHFDSKRPQDRKELFALVSKMEAKPAIRAMVNRLIRHTGRQSGTGAEATIGMSAEYNAGVKSGCTAHWESIFTLCHEVLHALVHPRFSATESKVSFPQVIVEGFTEVLGVELFNDGVVPKSQRDPAFKAALEAGVGGAPCPEPAKEVVRYGAAGKGAQEIRSKVGEDNFRAAYFLGKPELAGVPS